MKRNNINIIGIPEGEEEEQGRENLLEKVMMENIPNLMREKVTQIQEIQIVPIRRNPKRPTSIHIIVKMAKFQDKERILRAAREKQEVMYRGAPIRLGADFSMDTLSQKRMAKNIPSNENQGPATKTTLSSKALNQDRRPNKEFPRQKKSKKIHYHQTSSARDAKGTALRKGRKRERERNIGMKKWQ